MPRFVPLLLSSLLVLAGSAGSASAASLSLAAADQQSPQPFTVDVSGTADAPSRVEVLGEINGTTCAATREEAFTGREIVFLASADVPAGPFSARPQSNSSRIGRLSLCAYLVRGSETDASASASASYSLPACPTAAFTVTGVQTIQNSNGAVVSVDVPGHGHIAASGNRGGTGGGTAPGAGPATVDLVLASPPNKLVTETFTLTYTRFLPTPCTGPDGVHTHEISERRTATVTPPPPGSGSTSGSEVVRAVGATNLLDLFGGRPFRPFSIVTTGGVARDAKVDAVLTITVTAAVKAKHKLPSTTIAKTGPFVPNGEFVQATPKVTKAMLARLKKAKVKKLTTKMTWTVTSPLKSTTTKRQVLQVGKLSASVKYERLCLGSSNETFKGCTPDR